MKIYPPLTQVAYVPDHAENDVAHPDVEFGFITANRLQSDGYFVRYWRKGHPGELRTCANSELTPARCIVPFKSVPQMVVIETVKNYGIQVSLT